MRSLLSSAPVSSSLSSLTNTTRESDSLSDVTRQGGPGTCVPNDPSCLSAGHALDTYLPNRVTLLPGCLSCLCIVHPPPCPIYNSQSLGVMWHVTYVPMVDIMILARCFKFWPRGGTFTGVEGSSGSSPRNDVVCSVIPAGHFAPR